MFWLRKINPQLLSLYKELSHRCGRKFRAGDNRGSICIYYHLWGKQLSSWMHGRILYYSIRPSLSLALHSSLHDRNSGAWEAQKSAIINPPKIIKWRSIRLNRSSINLKFSSNSSSNTLICSWINLNCSSIISFTQVSLDFSKRRLLTGKRRFQP